MLEYLAVFIWIASACDDVNQLATDNYLADMAIFNVLSVN